MQDELRASRGPLISHSENGATDCLPSEILRDIFLKTLLRSLQDGGFCRSNNSILTPLYISHVCRRWREISLSFGELWSYLRLWYDGWIAHIDRKKDDQLVEVFETWLDRTNSLPLNVVAYCTPCHTATEFKFEYFIETLLNRQDHWKDVDFTWIVPSVFDSEITMSDMPLLTSFKLGIKFVGIRTKWKHATVDLSNSPRLLNLRLDGDFLLRLGKEPMLNLTDFYGFFNRRSYYIAIQMSLEILRAAPNLKLCEAIFRSGCSDNTPTPLTHDLQALKLSRDPSRVLIRSLTLPSLTYLNYDNYAYDSQIDLCNFLRRSRPPMTTLEIEGETRFVDIATLIPVLRLLSSLQTLRIGIFALSAQFFQELTLNRSAETHWDLTSERDDIICPALESFGLAEVNLRDYRDQCVDALCDMFVSRWTVVQLIRRGETTSGAEFDASTIFDRRDELVNYIENEAKVRAEGAKHI